ncbi:MAG TPA: c-type cytochrome [Thermoanaerobaculia bacterium]|nr:c-type cytochrome [Thermoanaerobaculia bacterium]
MHPSKALVLVIAVLAWTVLLAAVPATGAGADGKAIFLAQKCNLCHSIETAGIERTSKAEKTKGPDLAGAAKRHDAEWIKKFLTKQEQLNGKKHLKEVKSSPEELDALVAWVSKQ